MVKKSHKTKTSKYEKALTALDIIARPYDEDELIVELEEEKGIIITEEDAPAYRANEKAVWVEIPHSEKLIQKAKTNPMVADLYRELATTIEKNGKKYDRIPVNEVIGNISTVITDELCQEHGICDNDLTSKQWEQIIDTPEWKQAEKQKLREIIASDLETINKN